MTATTDTRTAAAQLVAEADAERTYEYLVTVAADELDEPTSFFTTGERDAHGFNTYNWLRAAEACIDNGYTTSAAVRQRGEDLAAMRWAASKGFLLSVRVTVFNAQGEPLMDTNGDMYSREVKGAESAAEARTLAHTLLDLHEDATVVNLTELYRAPGQLFGKHNRSLAAVRRDA